MPRDKPGGLWNPAQLRDKIALHGGSRAETRVPSARFRIGCQVHRLFTGAWAARGAVFFEQRGLTALATPSWGAERLAMGRKLYVGNLSYSATGQDLESIFKDHGTVTSASVATDRETGRSRGFGFVEMSTDEEAEAAVNALNGTNFQGRQLKVNEARPRPAGGGGGGGGRGGHGGEGGGGGRRRW